MSLFLMSCFALGITGQSGVSWGLGLLCLALAVGCRPFQACFVPFGVYMLYLRLREKHGLPVRLTLLRMSPYLLAPMLVALMLGWYNWVRFSNPFEFGHNYLPEFTEDPEQVQFGLKYIPNNLANIFRLPEYRDWRLEFSMFDGFAFYLTNPLYVTAGISALQKLRRRKWDAADTLLLMGLAGELFLLLCHRTFGGWQYGARYLCDLLPMLVMMELRGRDSVEWWEILVCIVAVCFNLYGTTVFHMMDMGV